MTPSDGRPFPGKFWGDQVRFLLPCQAPQECGGVELDTPDHSSTPEMIMPTRLLGEAVNHHVCIRVMNYVTSWPGLTPQKISPRRKT